MVHNISSFRKINFRKKQNQKWIFPFLSVMVSRQNKRKIKSFLVTAFIVVAGVLTVRWIMGNRDESNKPQFDFDEDDIMMVALKARQDKLKSSPPIVANPIFAEIPEPVDDADVQKANEILEAAEGRQQAKKDDASRKLTEVDKKEESLKKILKMIESNEDSGKVSIFSMDYKIL